MDPIKVSESGLDEEKQESPAVAAARARLLAAKARTVALDEDEQTIARLLAEEEKESARYDREIEQRLNLEADRAASEARAAHPGRPILAMVSVNSYKAGGPGWAVLTSPDKGHAINAMKAAGNYDVKRGGLKVLETDPDVFIPQVKLATLAHPCKDAEAFERALYEVPQFALALYRKVENLGGGDAEEASGKSRR